jgi:uncharacterized membrane protein
MSKSIVQRTNASVSGVEHAQFDINAVIGWILQGGVFTSAAVICAGLALLFVHPEQLSNQQFLTFPHTLGEVKDGLLALHPQAFIALGLLLLIATPVIRVATSIFAFAKEHDRCYVVITTVVLAILLISFLLGKGAG